MNNKKRIKFPKYQVFKHTTESKKKNMVDSNPEILKRKAVTVALNPTYVSDSTGQSGSVLQYTLVPGTSQQE